MAMKKMLRTTPSMENRVSLIQRLVNSGDYVGNFGYNPTVGTVEEPIWAQSGVAYTFPTSAQALTLSSGNANESSAGSGARTVTIEYLDANYDHTSVTLSMNGQTAVAIGQGMRVNRMYVETTGGVNNTGIIYVGYGTVTAGVPATILATIAPGTGQTLQSIYTVPNGKTAYLLDVNTAMNAKGEIRLNQRQNGKALRIQRRWPCDGGQMSHELNFPLVFPAKTDLEFRGIATTGTVAISVDFEMWLE